MIRLFLCSVFALVSSIFMHAAVAAPPAHKLQVITTATTMHRADGAIVRYMPASPSKLLAQTAEVALASKPQLITTETTIRRVDGVIMRFVPASPSRRVARAVGLATVPPPTEADLAPCLTRTYADFAYYQPCSITDKTMATTDFGMGYVVNLDGVTPTYSVQWRSSNSVLGDTFQFDTVCPANYYHEVSSHVGGTQYCWGAGAVGLTWPYPAATAGSYTFTRSTTDGVLANDSATVKLGNLKIDSGDGQTTLINAKAQAPLVAAVWDYRGNRVSFPVDPYNTNKPTEMVFTILGPSKSVGQIVNPTFGLPGSSGTVSVAATAGNKVGTYTINVTSADTTPLSPGFTLNAVSRLPPPDNTDKKEGDGNDCQGAVADPITVGIGNSFQQETDYAQTGLSILEFKRSYNALGSKGRLMGNYWTTTFDIAVIPPPVAGAAAYVRRPDGKFIPFILQSGVYQSARPYFHGTLRTFGTGWQYVTEDNATETYDAQGKWTSTVDALGRSLTATYNSSALLTKVAANTGESLTFTYNTFNQIATATDQAGRVWTYAYNGYANLTQIKDPDGLYHSYAYEAPSSPYLLTGIGISRNATPNVADRYVTWAFDASGRATSNYFTTTLPTGIVNNGLKRFDIVYNDITGERAVTDALGNKDVFQTAILNGRGFVNGVVGPGFSSCGLADSVIQRDVSMNVVSSTAFGRTTQFGNYDYNGQYGFMLEAAGKPTARQTNYVYDARFIGKPVSITRPSVASGKSKATQFTYDASGNVLQEVINGFRPDGTAVSRSYTFQYAGPYGQLSQIDGPRTDVADLTKLDYNTTTKRLLRVTDPNGIVVRNNISYTTTGQIAAEDRPNGLHVAYAYYPGTDQLQSVTESGTGATRTTTWTYNDHRWVASLTFSDGVNPDLVTGFVYDTAGDLTQILSSNGSVITYTLDNAGNHIKDSYTTTTEARWIQRTFDAYGRLQQLINPYTQSSSNFHPDGTLTSSTDGRSNTTSHTYDDFKRLTQTIQPGTITTTFGYDTEDRLTQVTDGNQGTTSQAYDDLGERVNLTSPDNGTTLFGYDAAGNETNSTDALGQATTYTYDPGNRLRTIDRVGVADDVTYAYDTCTNGLGKVCSATTGAGEFANYSYDVLGRVASITTNAGIVGYTYDAGGDVTQITYPSLRKVQYTRDGGGQVTGVSVVDGGSLYVLARAVTHLPFGPASGWVYGNGLTETRQYDLQYRPTTFNSGTSSAVTYGSYDGDSNPTQRTVNGDAQAFGFDPLDRLGTASGRFGTRTYGYDNVGNRTSLLAGTQTTSYAYQPQSNRLLSDSNWTYSRDANGNETQRKATNGSGWQLTYTANNRLLGVTDLLNPAAQLGAYRYNALGQRTVKSTTTGDTRFVYGLSGELLAEELPSGSVTQEYVYLDGAPIALLDPPASPSQPVVVDQIVDSGTYPDYCVTTKSRYALNGDYQKCTIYYPGSESWPWLARISGGYDVSVLLPVSSPTAACYRFQEGLTCAGGSAAAGSWVALGRHHMTAGMVGLSVDTADSTSVQVNLDGAHFTLAQTDLTTRDYKYVHTDALGTPLRVTDKSGVVIWQASYDPFGAATVNDDPDGDGVHQALNLRFPGQYFDAETGLHYNYFRDYDKDSGRYIESDPIGLWGGTNTYAYTGGNPTSFIDPIGLDALVIAGGYNGGLNPFGHVGMAVTGQGIYSYGNDTRLGSGVLGYILSQSQYRNQMIVLIPSTPGQDSGMMGYFGEHPGKNDVGYFDNCAVRTNSALMSGDVPVQGIPFPGGTIRDAASLQGAQTFFIPQGGPIPQALLDVLPGFESWH